MCFCRTVYVFYCSGSEEKNQMCNASRFGLRFLDQDSPCLDLVLTIVYLTNESEVGRRYSFKVL